MRNIAILVALSGAGLTGCGSKTDANERNFGAAMTHYFDRKGALCLNINRWPIDLSEMDFRLQKTMEAGSVSKMAALEAAGLVRGEDTEVDRVGMWGKPTGAKTRIRRYTLSDDAEPFVQEKQVASTGLNGTSIDKQVDLCWGKKALGEIVKWEGPMKFGDYQVADITYTYEVKDLAGWARAPEVQAAFPALKSVLDGAGSERRRHTVKLTSEGWEANGLD
ncbi:hypothetical protein [Stenotrophomonas maltophilia]|uniref:hypothetical protein n=1 Tax=Stenotrophomonas maltophilia TaxID=40324 RepID=UPI0020A648AD|nr:hypothetical protein [Stenotrophomonas maltophilia]